MISDEIEAIIRNAGQQPTNVQIGYEGADFAENKITIVVTFPDEDE